MNDIAVQPGPEPEDKNPLAAVYATRRANLRLLIAGQISAADLAKQLGYTSGAFISQLLSEDRTFTEVTARSLEIKLGLTTYWLDLPRGS